jgi:TupA-like ATPgrasp
LPELQNPASYTDHMFRLMLSPECMNPLRQFVTDKEYMKHYVRGAVGDAYNVRTYGVLRHPRAIERAKFPDQCVIKPTHLCSEVIRRERGEEVPLATLQRWFRLSHYRTMREGNYRYLQPKIMVEEYLREDGRECPSDYKIYCFHGVPAVVQVDLDRTGVHRRAFYSVKWQPLPCDDNVARHAEAVPRPDCLEEMLTVARKLSAAFNVLRVDLYASSGGVKVGELTNFPAGGRDPFRPPDVDIKLARLFSEPNLDVFELLSS